MALWRRHGATAKTRPRRRGGTAALRRLGAAVVDGGRGVAHRDPTSSGRAFVVRSAFDDVGLRGLWEPPQLIFFMAEYVVLWPNWRAKAGDGLWGLLGIL